MDCIGACAQPDIYQQRNTLHLQTATLHARSSKYHFQQQNQIRMSGIDCLPL